MPKQKKYFFPSPTPCDDLVFNRHKWNLAYLAGTYHNVFVDIFKPESKPTQKETFRLFPAMMLYRHAVELLLKAIIKDKCGEKPPTNTHNLADLFSRCRAIDGEFGDDLAFVQEALGELQEVDPGHTFRFGFDKDGNACFPDAPDTVDSRRLYEVCERLWCALWSVHGPVGSPR